MSSLYYENNTLVSYSKYRIIYWLCISNHKICGVSFLRITAFDFAVGKEKAVFLWFVTLSSPFFSPFPPSFSSWIIQFLALWGRLGGRGSAVSSQVWTHLQVCCGGLVKDVEGKLNEAVSPVEGWGGLVWDTPVEGWLASRAQVDCGVN